MKLPIVTVHFESLMYTQCVYSARIFNLINNENIKGHFKFLTDTYEICSSHSDEHVNVGPSST
jgi:hypothetical protein